MGISRQSANRRKATTRKSDNKALSHHRLRIIGGRLRRRQIQFFTVDGLRPSTDKTREMLFNWLEGEITGARCLDLFAGSGILGFEAISRGASALTSVDKSSAVIESLTQSAGSLKLSQFGKIELIGADALAWLAKQRADSEKNDSRREPYSLVFLDPPFSSNLLAEAISMLDRHPLIGAEALVYIEFASEQQPAVPPTWQLVKNKKSGQVVSQLYQIRDMPLSASLRRGH